MGNEEKAYLYWLHSVPKIGDGKMERLLTFLGSARGVYYATDKQLLSVLKKEEVEEIRKSSKEWKVMEAYEKMTERGIKMVCRKEEAYPKRLSVIKQAPFVLYYMGELPKEGETAVAIIGARECSQYGAYVGEAFAEKLASAGVNIISGMARGIDGIGQKAALKAGGSTYAVLGCGVDVCYPASHRGLYEQIKGKGGIISPFLPGQMPQKTLFPYRNRIVAGLSDCVLVIEARHKSGTWITVDMALEQGKEVYAVPGRLTDRLSDGCNLLIKQGAGIVLSPEDLLAELAVVNNRKNGYVEGSAIAEKEEEGVLGMLDFLPKSAEDILGQLQKENSEITYAGLMYELVKLCMEGKARQISGNYFVKTVY